MGTRSSSSRCSPCSPKASEDAGQIAAPPAIQALLAARLDRLEPEERRALECASVEGEIFHLGAVVDLSPPEAQEAVASQLMSLVRKELIRPEVPTLPGRRRSASATPSSATLPTPAAQGGALRPARALRRLARAGARRPARRGRGVPRLPPRAGPPLPRRARRRWTNRPPPSPPERVSLFASAGRRAFMRGDWPATVNLCERALALLAVESPLRPPAHARPRARARPGRAAWSERMRSPRRRWQRARRPATDCRTEPALR